MSDTLQGFPYYDDSEHNNITNADGQYTEKQYRKLAFQPGKAIQARELNQVQSFQELQNKENFNTLYKSGSIVSDSELSINDDGASNYFANITAGQFYYDGRVLPVDAQQIPISGTGTEQIGFQVLETIITVGDDIALKDPAHNTLNYGLTGANRVKIEVLLKKIMPVGSAEPLESTEIMEDVDGVKVVWNLEDAEIQNYVRRPDYSLLSDVLAKRTYDESGNYLVDGMKLRIEDADTPNSEDPYSYKNPEIKVVVDQGTCYVKGYDNTFIIPKTKNVSRALTTKELELEIQTFSAGTSSYQINNPYVVIDDFTTYPLTVDSEVNVTHTQTKQSGDYDDITDGVTTYTRVTSITSIVGYALNVDYELSADRVHWLTSNRPSIGVDYDIEFDYLKNSVKDTDYEVVEDAYSPNLFYINWLGIDDPVDTSNFFINYFVYQARTDLITINKFGDIIIKEGIPTDYDKLVIPSFDQETLPLGWIKFYPGTYNRDECLIYEYKLKRTTMFELHNVKKRVNDLEENQATLALENEAKDGEIPTTLKGILVDNFTNNYKANITHNDYYCAINMIDEELSMVTLDRPHDIDRTADTTSNLTAYKDDSDVDKQYGLTKTGDIKFFENTLKSDTMNLNPYGIIKKSPVVSITPDKDLWIDYSVIEKTIVNDEVRKTITNINMLKWSEKPRSGTKSTEEKMVQVGKNVSQSKIEIDEKLITFARSGKEIAVKGRNFEPASEVSAVFGGFSVPLYATGNYRNEEDTGTPTGRVLVASDGSFTATFEIPQGVKSGDIDLKLVDQDNNEFELIYSSKGVRKIIENRTTITNTYDKFIDIFKYKKPPQPRPKPVTPPAPTPPKPKCVEGERKRKICTDVGQPLTYGTFIYNFICKKGEWVATGQRCVPITPEIPPEIPPPPLPVMLVGKGILDREEIRNDPLAQSFIFRDDKILTAIDFFFGTKANDNTTPVSEADLYNYSSFEPTDPAILTIGLMRNGFPDSANVMYMQEIQPNEITTSLYGDAPTNIQLKRPVYLPSMQEFYISIGSKSTDYTIYVSTLGQNDISTGNLISKNPYLDGVLFASSNGVTWTPLQKKDMSIVLYTGEFETTGSFETEITNVNAVDMPLSADKLEFNGFGRFMYLNDYVEIPGSKVNFYYKTEKLQGSTYSWTDYVLFNPQEEIDLGTDNTGIQFKADLIGDGKVTPFVDLENILIFYKYDIRNNITTGLPVNMYMTKAVTNVPDYNSVKLMIDEDNIASATNVIKEFSFDNTNSWIRFTEDADEELVVGNGYTRKTYNILLGDMQKVTLTTADYCNNFAIGDVVEGDSSGGGKVVGIDSNSNALYILLETQGTTEFVSSENISVTGTPTTNDDIISVVNYFENPPSYPTQFIARMYLESTVHYASPMCKNLRFIMKQI